jgi:molybdate/tungstate transport system substrate-binding protein
MYLTSRTVLASAILLIPTGPHPSARPRSGVAVADTVVVFDAGTLALPIKAVFDSFATRSPAVLVQENAGSLETARKLIDLGRVPDVIALADYEIFPRLLVPQQTAWYVPFARNRMVLAYTDRSKGAAEISPQNWWQVITRPGVEVGRSDPNLDPAGYRALLVFQLAEREYNRPGLANALERAAPARNVRPKSADLVALLQTGELDYGWGYESVAQAAHLRYVHLSEHIDLGEPADSAFYAHASVRVTGKTPADTVAFRGEAIVYALSIPTAAPHPTAAARFVAFLLSPAGARVMRSAQLDALDKPVIVGRGAPPMVAASITAH